MSKLLYIIASPQAGTASFSRKVADAFVGAYHETHPDDAIEVLDLWATPLPEFGAVAASWKTKVITGQTPNEEEEAERANIEGLIEQFKGADKYVFSIPMWNFSVPYKLKHYIDIIVQPGLTFGFDPATGYFGLVPSERPVYVVHARGGTYAPGSPTSGLDFQQPYIDTVLGFVGLTQVTTQLVEATAYPPEVSDPILNEAITAAQVAAKSF